MDYVCLSDTLLRQAVRKCIIMLIRVGQHSVPSFHAHKSTNYTVWPNLDETKDINVTQPGTRRRNYRLWVGVKEL